LGRVGADDVGAQDLAVLRVPDDLDEAFRLARSAGPTVGGEGEFPDLVVDFLFLDLRLGQADRRNFRMAISSVGNVAVIHLVYVLLAGEKLGEHDAFALSLVRQHWRASDVSYGVG